jgi:hypothetical protein
LHTAIRYNVKDFGESLGNNLCTIVALFCLYQLAFMYWVLVTLSIEVHMVAVAAYKTQSSVVFLPRPGRSGCASLAA